MKSSRFHSLMAASMIAALGAGISLAPIGEGAGRTAQATAPSLRKATRQAFASSGGYQSKQRRSGPGWSFRQVQRMAQKRRNVLRNRKAHR